MILCTSEALSLQLGMVTQQCCHGVNPNLFILTREDPDNRIPKDVEIKSAVRYLLRVLLPPEFLDFFALIRQQVMSYSTSCMIW